MSVSCPSAPGLARPGQPGAPPKLLRIIGLALAGLALALLGGCSAIKLAYNSAPDFSYWWLDGYADFNDEQTALVREELQRLHRWHRSSELPRLADLLQQAGRMTAGNITEEQVCNMFEAMRARALALSEQAEPAVVALAPRISAEQRQHIERKFAKANTEWRADYLEGNAQKRSEKRLEAQVERSEQFYGKLQEPQLAVLRSALEGTGFNPDISYTERLRRQQDLLQTLRAVQADPGSARSRLRQYLERVLESPDPQYRAYSQKVIAGSCRLVALLHNGTNAEQRERAARRIAAYERDARELAAQR